MSSKSSQLKVEKISTVALVCSLVKNSYLLWAFFPLRKMKFPWMNSMVHLAEVQ